MCKHVYAGPPTYKIHVVGAQENIFCIGTIEMAAGTFFLGSFFFPVHPVWKIKFACSANDLLIIQIQMVGITAAFPFQFGPHNLFCTLLPAACMFLL